MFSGPAGHTDTILVAKNPSQGLETSPPRCLHKFGSDISECSSPLIPTPRSKGMDAPGSVTQNCSVKTSISIAITRTVKSCVEPSWPRRAAASSTSFAASTHLPNPNSRRPLT